MKYDIFGGTLPAVEITLDKGEGIYTQSGGMAWMTDDIAMETNTKGGIFKGLARSFSGDSMFMATYTANKDNERITFSAATPGEIRPITIDSAHEYIAQKGAFLCAENGVISNRYLPNPSERDLSAARALCFRSFRETAQRFWSLTAVLKR